MMIDARLFFLGLTALLLAILVAIGISTYRKNNKEKLEKAKYRMLDDE